MRNLKTPRLTTVLYGALRIIVGAFVIYLMAHSQMDSIWKGIVVVEIICSVFWYKAPIVIASISSLALVALLGSFYMQNEQRAEQLAIIIFYSILILIGTLLFSAHPDHADD